MFAAVQVPLADLRHFVVEPTGRLPVPPWPLADPSKHFVRAVGPVRQRRRGGVPEWIGESLYCDARHAVSFPPEQGSLQHAGSPLTYLTPQYRRFLATGRAQWASAIARMDVGLKVSGRKPSGRVTNRFLPIPKEAALAAATVMIGMPPDSRLRTLVSAGGAIAERIRIVTTSLIDPPAYVRPWWVQAGRPLVLVEAPFTREFVGALDPPMDVDKAIAEGRDALALQHFSHIEYRGQIVPVWTLFYGRQISDTTLRLLRIHLWRLHNEREVLRLVLAACLQKQLNPSQPALRDYLARQSSSLRQVKREGLPQSGLLFRAYALDSLVNASDIGALSGILRDVSPGLAASVLPLAENIMSIPDSAIYITVNGGLQVADNIDYSQHIGGAGHIGAVIGGQANVGGGNYQGGGTQNIQILDRVDMSQLADELQRLAMALAEKANSPERQAAVEHVKRAGAAAQQKDKMSAWNHLVRTGKWVFDIATQIGVSVAAAVIAAAIAL